MNKCIDIHITVENTALLALLVLAPPRPFFDFYSGVWDPLQSVPLLQVRSV